jgi:hypothetical protein
MYIQRSDESSERRRAAEGIIAFYRYLDRTGLLDEPQPQITLAELRKERAEVIARLDKDVPGYAELVRIFELEDPRN